MAKMREPPSDGSSVLHFLVALCPTKAIVDQLLGFLEATNKNYKTTIVGTAVFEDHAVFTESRGREIVDGYVLRLINGEREHEYEQRLLRIVDDKIVQILEIDDIESNALH